ncbi:MAG: molecular chaperone HtpG, partial [Spirosomataceae bacterium]
GYILLKNVKDEFFTLDEYKDKVALLQTDKDETTVILYASDKEKQDAYIKGAAKRDYDVVLLDDMLDSHFINALEQKLEKTTFKRVDAEIFDKLIDKGLVNEVILSDDEKKTVEEAFKPLAGNNVIQIEALSVDEMPVSIVMPEFMRRYADMAKMNGGQAGMFGAMPQMHNIVVNGNHPLIAKLSKAEGEEQTKLATQLHDLALLSQGMLSGNGLTQFIERSVGQL